MAKKQILQINRLRSLFPGSVHVNVRRSKDGGFVAVIKTFSGCVTQADSFAELIEMVNDAVRTYFEVPQEYLPFMPTYLPPLKEAQRFDAFPITATKTDIKLELPNIREKVSR